MKINFFLFIPNPRFIVNLVTIPLSLSFLCLFIVPFVDVCHWVPVYTLSISLPSVLRVFVWVSAAAVGKIRKTCIENCVKCTTSFVTIIGPVGHTNRQRWEGSGVRARAHTSHNFNTHGHHRTVLCVREPQHFVCTLLEVRLTADWTIHKSRRNKIAQRTDFAVSRIISLCISTYFCSLHLTGERSCIARKTAVLRKYFYYRICCMQSWHWQTDVNSGDRWLWIYEQCVCNSGSGVEMHLRIQCWNSTICA